MKLKLSATIATALVIVAGFIMISPLFLRSSEADGRQRVMLSFSVSQHDNAPEWCERLASLLNTYDIGATVFFAGNVAERFPRSVSSFSRKVDIGSQTYSYQDLTSVADYSIKLREVKEGKNGVDQAGKLDSRVFRAPFGATDPDIYSLLSRAGIVADFSYDEQYNVYQDGQFVRHSATVYQGRDYSPEFFSTLSGTAAPIIIVFDDTDSVNGIEAFISGLKLYDLQFVNASELTGVTLTSR